METLEKIDTDLFLFLNGIHNSFFDFVFWYSSKVVTWIPLYLFFLFLVFKKYGNKSWLPVVGAILLIVATDRGSTMIKKSVKRYRPSHNIEIKDKVHILNGDDGGKHGFVSSHAANTFGIAVYMVLLLRLKKKYFSFLILFWAAFVSYGRIYGGLHYPADIFAGALLGIVCAVIIYKLQNHLLKTQLHYKEI